MKNLKTVVYLLLIYAILCANTLAQEGDSLANRVEKLYNQAVQYHNAGELQQALELYTKVIELDPTHANSYWYRSTIYGQQEKYELAIPDLRKVNDLAPGFSDAYGLMGWYLILQGKFEEAKQPTEKALELTPESMAWTLNLGHIYMLTGRQDSARVYYEKSLPLLKTEEEFKTVSVAEFELFIKKNLQPAACAKELTWLKGEFTDNFHYYLQADSLCAQAKASYQQLDYLQAANLFTKAVACEEAARKPRKENLASALVWAGNCFQNEDNYADAEPLYQRALAILEKVLGPEHQYVATSLNSLAVLYEKQGKYADAEPLHQRALAIYEKVLGPEHQYVAISLNNLAELYRTEGKYAAAEPLYQRALAIREKVLGSEHADVAASLNNLALLYKTQGKYSAAEPLYQRALAILKKVLGPEHADVATSLNNLASLYDTQGKYAEAESLYQRARVIYEKVLEPEHPDVAANLNNLASLYDTQGKYAEAESLYQRALAIYEKVLGPEHQNVATSLNNLAGLYNTQGKYAKAEPLYQRARAIYEKVLGPEHQNVAASLNNLAGLYNTQGKYTEAGSLYQRAMAILEKVLEPEHPDVAASLNNLATLYETQGKYADAEPLYQRARAILEKVLGPEHPDVAQSLNNLATLYQEQGKYAAAEPLYQRARAILEKVLGPEHPDVAQSLNNLAGLYYTQGKYAAAEPLYQRALAIDEQALGTEHPDVATNLNNLAGLYEDRGKYAAAESLYQRALAIDEQALGTEHPDVATNLNNLAGLYEERGKYAAAESLYQRARAIREKGLGPEHPRMAQSLSNLGFFYERQGKYAAAEPFFKRGNSNLLHQINTNFPAMSEKEREQFYETINSNFEAFHSFCLKRITENPAISAEAYNNQLAVKALLLNSTAKVKRQILNSNDNDLINLYRQWISQKEYLAKVYALSKAEIAHQGVNKDSLEAFANTLEKQLSRRSEAFAQAMDTTLFTWYDVQKMLQPHEAAIEMVRFQWYHKTWTDTVYYVALIVTAESKDHPAMVVLKYGNDLEGKFYRGYAKCRQTKSGLAYQQYWQPIQEKLKGITKVYFSPDGIYNQMNLNILFNPETGAYVLDEIDIHLVTSTKDLLQLKNKKSTIRQAELFGRPVYQLDTLQLLAAAQPFQKRNLETSWLSDQERAARGKASFSDLPGTEKEVNDIGKLLKNNNWQASVHTGKEALEEDVKAVNNPVILHIATHGFFIQSEAEDFRKGGRNVVPLFFNQENNVNAPSGTNPMLRSGLLLAGAATYLNAEKKPNTEDGILTAYEAANLDLDNTELVVLSACETGLGDVKNGEGVYGLQRAFKVSGAKTILMSLWKVDDTATQELMTAFYSTWLKTGDKRQAFRQVQQQIRDKYKLPEYWGAFVMVGE